MKKDCMFQYADANGNIYENTGGSVGMDDGVPRRVDRLRALGNAIVPQVAMEIMRAIKETN